jgi:dihydropteroate synthase
MPFPLPSNRPLLMGILNVTPDSFSDGGVHFGTQIAIDAGLRMMDEGADVIDVGGESTKPGSAGVTATEELRRVMPVIQNLIGKGVPISIDTSKAVIANNALAAGASIVNDVTALGDPHMLSVCVDFKCTLCLMHMQGKPRTMQVEPHYDNVVKEVRTFLIERADTAERAGVEPKNIWIDPGIGFGKTVQHNLDLLKHVERFVDTGYPVLIGTSRKSFIGKVLAPRESEPLPSDQRQEGTLATQMWAQMKGAKIIRTHDVLAARRTMDMLAVLENPK